MSSQSSVPLFSRSAPEPAPRSFAAWALAACVVLILLAGLLVFSRRHAQTPANVVLPLDPYARNLAFSNLQMSESSSLSGFKATFIDGQVRNTGSRTVSAIDLQVLFANDLQMPPQIESVPLNLIRTHEPYIDTEAVSAAPIAPGETREFRLAFENISQDWNQALPRVDPVRVHLK